MSDNPEIDGGVFRQVLGNYPTGVTLVTAVDENGPCAMVIGSFGSVSLDPQLVQFMPTTTSGTWARIESSGSYCVNVLGADQLDVCNGFFKPDGDPFDQVEWRTGITGSTIIEGCLAAIDCHVEVAHAAGDHYIGVGRVQDLAVGDSYAGHLLFFQGGYGEFSALGGD